jgi:hypothetical protein
VGSPVWALAGVGQASAGKVARGSSIFFFFFFLVDLTEATEYTPERHLQLKILKAKVDFLMCFKGATFSETHIKP